MKALASHMTCSALMHYSDWVYSLGLWGKRMKTFFNKPKIRCL